MDQALESKLIKEFPSMFVDMYGDPQYTCLAFGLECNKGWFPLIYNACKKIAKFDGSKTFKFNQIKEKFGGLRLYCEGGNQDIYKIIDQAEKESYETCENCGTKKNVTTEGGWIQTLCKSCRAKPAV